MKYIVMEDRHTQEIKILKCEVGEYDVIFIEGRGKVPVAWWQKEHILENKGNFYFEDGVITKISDDLKKLFDDVVVVHKGVHYTGLCNPLFKPVDILNYIEEEYGFDKNDCLIYGAIWTDKGLIYVAKPNDKGEWELL